MRWSRRRGDRIPFGGTSFGYIVEREFGRRVHIVDKGMGMRRYRCGLIRF